MRSSAPLVGSVPTSASPKPSKVRSKFSDAATLAELAHHWVAATRPADLDKALGYVQLAGGTRPSRRCHPTTPSAGTDTRSTFSRNSHQTNTSRALLLAKLGTAQRQAAHPEFRETLLQAAALAEQVNDTAVLVQAALGFSQGETMSADDDITRVASAALDRIGTDPTPTARYGFSPRSRARRMPRPNGLLAAISLEAMGVARDSGDAATFVQTMDPIQTSLATPDRLAGAIDDMQDTRSCSPIGSTTPCCGCALDSIWSGRGINKPTFRRPTRCWPRWRRSVKASACPTHAGS